MEEQAGNVSAIDSLESELNANFEQLRQGQQARLEQLATLMGTLESAKDDAASGAEALQSMQEAAAARLSTLKADFNAPDEKIRELQTRIDELTVSLDNSEREKGALADKIQAKEGEIAELASLQNEIAAKNETLETTQREFEALRHAHDQEHGELEQARERLRETEERLNALEASSSQVGELEDRIRALEAELESKNQALENAQESLEQAQGDQQKAASEFEALSHAQSQAEAAQEGLKTELMAVQREMEALREKYREGLSTEAALALRQQVTETVEQVRSLEAELEQARGQSKKSFLAQQLAEAIAEAEQVAEENKRLKQEIALIQEGRPVPDAAPGEAPGPAADEVGGTAKAPEEELLRIKECAKNSAHGPKRVIGQILLDAGVISDEDLQQALEVQRSNPQQHLGAILTELGLATEEAVAQARASQVGVEFIRHFEDAIDPEAASLISERLANQHNCIPISATDREMVLAVTNPMDLLAIEDVERFTNKKVDVVVGTVPEIANAISRFYWEPE